MQEMKYCVCGIAFNHSFKLLDNWGKIADEILYGSKSFEKDFFNKISTQYTTERMVYNDETGNFLRLSANDVVFKYCIKDESLTSAYDNFCKKVKNHIIPKIIIDNSLITRRIGVVFAREYSSSELKSFSQRFFKEGMDNITDFRFAQKELTTEGRLWYDVNDYLNRVYTCGKIGDAKSFDGVTYDYQLYFNPPRADIRDISKDFFAEGMNSFKKDVLNYREER